MLTRQVKWVLILVGLAALRALVFLGSLIRQTRRYASTPPPPAIAAAQYSVKSHSLEKNQRKCYSFSKFKIAIAGGTVKS